MFYVDEKGNFCAKFFSKKYKCDVLLKERVDCEWDVFIEVSNIHTGKIIEEIYDSTLSDFTEEELVELIDR